MFCILNILRRVGELLVKSEEGKSGRMARMGRHPEFYYLKRMRKEVIVKLAQGATDL